MDEFIISCYGIDFKIICNHEIAKTIKKLMIGYCEFKDYSNNITYSLIIGNPKKINYNLNFRISDKWFNNASGEISINNNENIIYLTDIIADSEINKNHFIQYFACNVLNRLLEEKGFYGFHSSCVSIRNNGIAFIGKRGCGKTNSMLNMIHHGYDFLCNDKLALQYDGNNINCYGVAQDISIRMDLNFRSIFQNNKYVDYANRNGLFFSDDFSLDNNKISIYPKDLIKINNVNQVSTSQLKTVIFPSYDPNINHLIVHELSKNEIIQLLKENQLPLVHETKNFLKCIKTNSHSIYSFEDTCNQITNLNCFSITQNQNTVEEYAGTIKKLYLKY